MEKIFVLTLVALMGLSVLVSVDGKKYRDPCDQEKTPCESDDHYSPLYCLNSTCQCEEDMFWLDTVDRCVAPHEAPCTLVSGDGKPVRKCTDNAQCWPDPNGNSRGIRKTGICFCNPGSTFDKNVTLLCKLNYGSTECLKETDCDTSSILTCQEGKCVCADVENQVYDGSKCVALVEGTCGVTAPFPKVECSNNMKCNESLKLCQCLDGFTSTSDRTCAKPYNATCDVNTDCHPQFICNGNPKLCVCPSGQEYNSETGKCIILVGQACNATEGSLECTTHATCHENKCTCQTGYKSNSAAKCDGLYGSSCPEGTACNSDDFLQCGSNKTCECISNYESDDVNKKCKGKIEQKCRNDEDCVGNSKCNSYICGCTTGQQEAADNKMECYALYGVRCDNTISCSPNAYLNCINSTCNCKDQEKMTNINGACRAKEGAPCGTAAEGITCVVNANCITQTPQVCRCDNGFIANTEGRCIAGKSAGRIITGSIALVALLGLFVLAKV